MEPRRPALINKIIYFTGGRHNPYMSFGDTYMFYPIVVLDFIEALKEISRKKGHEHLCVRVWGGGGGGPVARAAPSPLSAWLRLSRAPYLHV